MRGIITHGVILINKTTQHVQNLEELAANSWPAHIQHTLGQWRLRATFGVTKRANSVYTVGTFPKKDHWLEIVEQFYRILSIPTCFHMNEASPPELDSFLELKGYQKIFECSIMTANCDDVMERVVDQGLDIRFEYEVTKDWLIDFLRLEGFSEEGLDAYEHIFSAIRSFKAFARITDGHGETIGMGTLVVEREWGGLSNIVISPAYRRKGIAAQLIKLLTQKAAQQGARNMYLQVINENTAAVTLYNKLGFTAFSQHHYRIQQE